MDLCLWTRSRSCKLKGSRICQPKIVYFGILIILTSRHLKCRDMHSVNSPYLPKCTSSKRDSISYIPFPGVLSTREDWLLPQTMLEVNTTPKLCHQLSYLLSILPRTHLSFLKVILPSEANTPLPLSLLKWYLSLNSKPLIFSRVWSIHIKNFFGFSLISLSNNIQGSQLKTSPL